MAVLARAIGIPSRVAVGFLPGKKVDTNTWSVSIHDMHAWPELFFAGFGWVRYEPTPASVTGTAPSWTLQSSDQPTGPASSEPSISASASARPSNSARADVTDAPVAGTGGSASTWGRTALAVGLGLLGLIVLAAPATLRVRRRSARLSTDAPPVERIESAWAEIRDTVADYGGTWPDGESPRQIGREIGGRLGPDESVTMSRVALLVEQSRYARAFDDTDGTRAVGDDDQGRTSWVGKAAESLAAVLGRSAAPVAVPPPLRARLRPIDSAPPRPTQKGHRRHP